MLDAIRDLSETPTIPEFPGSAEAILFQGISHQEDILLFGDIQDRYLGCWSWCNPGSTVAIKRLNRKPATAGLDGQR